MRTTLQLRYRFDIAHRIIGFRTADENLHGHAIHMTVEFVTDNELDDRQVVIDCHEADVHINRITELHDHKTILWQRDPLCAEEALQRHIIVVPYNPTAEGLAHHFFEQIQKVVPSHLHRVSISVDETIQASYGK